MKRQAFAHRIEWAKSNLSIVNAALVIITFIIMVVAYFYVTPQVTGDEPHYLLNTHALVNYHTFDLKKAYINEDYIDYYPAPGLLPQGDPKLISIDMIHVYPMHGIGLSIFLIPGYIIGSKNGAAVQMILLATAILCLTWLWCRRITGHILPAYLAVISLFISYFFIGLSGYIYPDMLIAATLLSCLLLITSSQFSSKRIQALIGLILGFSIFLHYRNIFIALPVLGWLSYLTWKAQKKLPWVALLITAVFAGAFVLSLYLWFGTINPSAPYGSLTTISNQPFANIAAMLFDSSRGLFVYNPILILIAIGLPLWFKLNRRSLLITLLIAGPTMGTLAFFDQWTGGAAPPGRYIIAFLPVLIPAIAFAFDRLTFLWQRICIALLALLTATISIDAIIAKFTFVSYDNYKGTSAFVEQLRSTLSINLEKILPSYTNHTELIGKFGAVKLFFCLAVLVCLLCYGYYLSRAVLRSNKIPK